MQVTALESKGLKKSFKIVVDAAQIQQELEAELRTAGERVKIPGFRPGFIPMKVLQQRYGKAVQADVIKNVINTTSNEALAQQKVRPAIMPQIEIDPSYQEGGDLTYTMNLEAFPEVPEVTFDNITLDRNTFTVEEKDIDEAVKRVSERAPTLDAAPAGAKAELGNVTVIDFKGMIDDVAFDGGAAEGFRLELGSKQFIEGFEDQLIGAKAGDNRMIKVTFPENYPSANLAGKEASFAVKINEILVKTPGVIDEEFAKARGFADLRAFREAIRNQLIKEYDQVVRRQLKKQLFDVLEESAEFELPATMLDMEFKSIWERVQQAKAEGDETLKDRTEEDLKEEYEGIAKRRVKLGILLAEIGNRNNVQVSREELGRAVMQQASQYPGQEKKVMDFYRNNPERMEDMRGPILEEKAVDLILTKVKFNDTPISVDDLIAEENEGEGSSSKKKTKSPKAKSAKSGEEAPKKKKAAE